MLVRVRIAAPPQVPRNQGYLLSTSELLFLAGASAWMAGTRHTRGELSRFLLTRGLWLIFLELTVITFAWYFTSELAIGLVVQVIWAIGASMLVFATLIHLPRLAIAGFGAALVLGHNLLDGLAPERFGAPAPLWRVLHVPGPLEIVFAQDSRAGRHLALGGAALIAAFVLLRALDGYGDHAHRLHEGGTTLLLMSFPNTTKYPPSLLYLLMTIGPALVTLAVFRRARGPVATCSSPSVGCRSSST